MKKILLALILMPVMALADTEVVDGVTWSYTVAGGRATVTKANPSSGTLTIPSTLGGCSVTSIGSGAFMGCANLTFVNLPEGLTSIKDCAFSGCSGLTSVTIPSSVTGIDFCAFEFCYRLKDLYFSGVNPPALSRESVFDGCHSDLVLHAPKGWKGRSRVFAGVYLVVEGKEEVFSDVEMPLVTCLYDISSGGEGETCLVTNFHEFAFYGISIDPKLMPLDEALNLYPLVVSNFNSKCETAGVPGAKAAANFRNWQEAMAVSFFTGFGELLKSRNQAHIGQVGLCVTNVAVNYVLKSVQPEFAIPATSDTGFVNIITEVKGGAVAVPASWADNYPSFTTKFGTDFTKALAMKTGKRDGAGNDMFVWQDYVAGTDPTKEDDVFNASITIVGGKVTISYSPELDDERKALRKYTTLGKKSLLDTDWTVVQEGQEAEYNFFKVSVEMK